MSEVIFPENHICLTSSKHIEKISKPLFDNSQLFFFDFTRIFPDASFIQLTSNIAPTQYLMSNGYHFLPSIQFTGNRNTYHLTNNNDLLKSHTHILKEKFSLENYFLIIQKQSDYLDVFGFGSTPYLHQPINFYLNNLKMLEGFTLLFKEKAKEIINFSIRCRLVLTGKTKLEYKKLVAFLCMNEGKVYS